MKSVLVDLYKANNPYSGLGQFSINFANSLIEHSPKNFDLRFLVPRNFIPNCHENVEIIHVDFQKRYLPSLTKRYDLWHSLNQFPAHFPNSKTKQLLTVHDLNFLFEKSEKKKKKYLDRLQKNISRADGINAISNYTKGQLEENIDLQGKEIPVIYNGVKGNSHAIGQRPKGLDDSSYYFSIGIFNRKKNFHLLVEMMRGIADKKLVLAGDFDTKYGQEVESQIEKLNLKGQIILIGKISESEKTWLYENCDAFLFPSSAEGFGLPVIEAMSYGKPVFLSKSTCLPEVGGDVAFYFNDYLPENMSTLLSRKMDNVQSNPSEIEKRLKLRANQFLWSKCINDYVNLYESLLQ